MQALPWLPRPLIIFVMIGETLTPCVQWHGQDWQGNISDEQMLFPLYGHDAQYIETVREDFWRVSFLGNMSAWNEKYPDCPYARVVDNKAVEGADAPIIRIIANELFEHDTFALTCFVVQCAEQGTLYSPATYDNRDAYEELPRYECDKDLQSDWRNSYLDPNRDIQHAVENMYLGFPGLHAGRYNVWRQEQRRREEAYEWS